MPVSEGLVLAGFSCNTNQSMHMEMYPGRLLHTRAVLCQPTKNFQGHSGLDHSVGVCNIQHSLSSQLNKLLKKRGLHKLVKGGKLTSTIYAAQLGWWRSKANQNKLTMIKNEHSLYLLGKKNLWSPFYSLLFSVGLPGGSGSKECPSVQGFDPGSGRSPGWQPTPVFFPGESHGQRSLAGYSPRGRRVRHDWVTNTLSFQFCEPLFTKFLI